MSILCKKVTRSSESTNHNFIRDIMLANWDFQTEKIENLFHTIGELILFKNSNFWGEKGIYSIFTVMSKFQRMSLLFKAFAICEEVQKWVDQYCPFWRLNYDTPNILMVKVELYLLLPSLNFRFAFFAKYWARYHLRTWSNGLFL